jgi:nicotinamidase-related amidase
MAGEDIVSRMVHCWEDVVPGEELARAQGAMRHDPRGSRPALLMVDLHNRAFGDRREPLDTARQRFPLACGEAAWEALPALEELLGLARRAGIPIVHTTGEPRPEAMLGRVTNLVGAGGISGEWDLDFVEGLRPREGELVIYKPMASAFFGTALATHLRRLSIDTLVIAGESTSGCVRASVVDAHSSGFGVLVVEDATFDRSEISHKVNLFDMHQKYAEVCHLEAVRRYLEGFAG